LEVRYGDVGDDGMEPYLRGFAMVNNRRIGTRADVQQQLFGGYYPSRYVQNITAALLTV
jgi:hypothetical protein